MYCIVKGTDSGRMAMELAKLIEEHSDKELLRLDAAKTSASEILGALDSQDLFSTAKLVILDNADFLTSKNTTKLDPAQFAKRKNTEDVIVFCVNKDSLDKRKKAVKEIIDAAKIIDCPALNDKNKESAVREMLDQRKLVFTPKMLGWYLARCGLNVLRISHELDKIASYSLRPSLQDLEAMVTPEASDNVFAMSDALFEGNGLRLLAFYRSFREQGMDAPQIIGLLASQTRFLFQVRCLMDMGYGKQDIAEELQAHPYRIELGMRKAARYSSQELAGILATLSKLDEDYKNGLLDKDEGFESFCLQFLK